MSELSETYQLLIEKYFLETLSLQEQISFEELYDSNELFKQQVDQEKSIQSAIYAEKRKPLKDLLIKEEHTIKQRQRIKAGIIFLVGIALLALILYFTQNTDEHIDAPQLYAEYMEPYPNVYPQTVRGASTEKQSYFMRLYDNQQYENMLEEYSAADLAELSDTVQFYYAIATLQTGNQDVSAQLFTSLAEKEIFKSESLWYTGLYYLKIDKSNDARRYFDEIIRLDQNEYYVSKTQEILTILK